jgi:hypothetical protein
MIPLTAEELAVLVQARDLLERLGGNPLTGGGLCAGVSDGIKLILKVSVLQDIQAMKMADNPMLEMQKLGIGIAGETAEEMGLTLAQPAGPLPGRAFTPASMKPDVPQEDTSIMPGVYDDAPNVRVDIPNPEEVESRWRASESQCEERHPNLGGRCKLPANHEGAHDSTQAEGEPVRGFTDLTGKLYRAEGDRAATEFVSDPTEDEREADV